MKSSHADPMLQCETKADWIAWLTAQHHSATGVWLRFVKRSSTTTAPSFTYAQALDAALCFGWIDGQKKSDEAPYWQQRFTPRAIRSIWSKINRDKALALIESGAMQPAGLREIDRARADGRWDKAYDPASTATVPADLQAMLDNNPKAADFFAALSSQNRYAILFRIHNVKKAETRARKIEAYVTMLERHEKIYP